MAKKPKKLTRALAVRYKCHDCLAQYEDGKVDCQNPGCPLYSFMPYKKKKPDLSMLEFNPKKKGLVTWEGEVIESFDDDDDFLD
jgi:hypothetical protein